MNVAVVIPLYNKAPYIQRTVSSIINQSVPVKEIIVVDDGSTDGGGEIVNSILDSRVRLIQQENMGQHAARNTGISNSSCPYIAFLDADDEWKPDFLSHIQRLVTNFPACGAYATSAQIIRPNGQTSYPRLVGLPPEPWIGILPNFFELFQVGFPFNSSSTVVPKKILEEVGGFPVNATYHGDVACWVKIALRYPIAFSPTRSVIYHQEAQNRAGSQYEGFLEEMPYSQMLRELIQSGEIVKEIHPELLEFYAHKQIWIAIQNIMAGNPSYARQLLATCRQTKKYRRDWLWWRFWASLPAGWPQKALNIKQKLIRCVKWK